MLALSHIVISNKEEIKKKCDIKIIVRLVAHFPFFLLPRFSAKLVSKLRVCRYVADEMSASN